MTANHLPQYAIDNSVGRLVEYAHAGFERLLRESSLPPAPNYGLTREQRARLIADGSMTQPRPARAINYANAKRKATGKWAMIAARAWAQAKGRAA